MLELLFSPPRLWIFIIFAAEVITYMILMTPKINLRLSVFLGVSVGFVIGFILIIIFWVNTIWAVIGLSTAVLYCAGTTVHIIKGKRYVKDIVEN
ncbi:MAG TPA: hypothetical protein VIL23_05970 [Clostridia bacterium]